MYKTIVYRNRAEVKLLSIVCGIVWGILYAITTIGDLMSQNPVFWHNQKCVWFMGFVFAIPVFIVSRFRIIFDFNNCTITKIGYFTRAKKYSFDEITVSVSSRGWHSIGCYIFKRNDQKIFQFSEIDFQSQTQESVDCLKGLFKGNEKFLYDIECSLEREGYNVLVYTYALEPHILRVHGGSNPCWIRVGFQEENGKFSVELMKTEIAEDSPLTEKLIEATTADFDSLECCLLELAKRHFVSD